MAQETRRTTLLAAGDVFPDHPDGEAMMAPLQPLLAEGDVVFGNCEGAYTDAIAPAPTHKHLSGAPAAHGDFFGRAGFTVMGLANNHAVDAGHSGLLDTIALLRGQGIAVTGAGGNPTEAYAPLVVEHDGTRVAFVSYCSVFPKGYEARKGRPGLAGLRMQTHYLDPDPNMWEPGVAAQIRVEPYPEDLQRLEESLRSAREQADVVIASFHWGYSSRLRDVQDYERAIARHAVDVGADAVLCHHHHALRAIEVWKGAPIYYGIGTLLHHLVVDAATRRAVEQRFGDLGSMAEDDAFELFPYRTEARRTGMAVLEIADGAIVSAGWVAAQMLPDGSTVPLKADDERATAVFDYLDDLDAHVGVDTTLRRGSWRGWAWAEIVPADTTSSTSPTSPTSRGAS